MKYTFVIEYGDEKTAHAIRIPDLDVSTAADTIEKAYIAATEAADVELQNFVATGEDIPSPSDVSKILGNPQYKDMGWGIIDIDITPYLGMTEKINVTMPLRVTAAIDKYVKLHNIKSRSSFLTEAALEKLTHP